MDKPYRQITIILFLTIAFTQPVIQIFGQGIGINPSGSNPDPSAILDVTSTSQGVRIPSVALTATNSSSPVANPVNSLLVYNTATINDVVPGFYYWDGTVSKWIRLLTTATGWQLTGNAGTSPGTNFIGTTDNAALQFKTNNSTQMTIDAAGRLGVGTPSPSTSAKMDVSSTTQGFLPPRMTSAQRDAIASPAAGLMIFNTSLNCMEFYTGTTWSCPCFACGTSFTFTYKGSNVTYGTVSHNGHCWLDRNLGAAQVATSSTDATAYGDLFQWGRLDDGHQTRTSGTTTTLATSDVPGHGNFIIASSTPWDWRNPKNDNLWQGVSGTNNPCPSGWRLPTANEWIEERLSWTSQNSAGAFSSPLKLTMTGARCNTGALCDVNGAGHYWASTVAGNDASKLYFHPSAAFSDISNRMGGVTIRCIKD